MVLVLLLACTPEYVAVGTPYLRFPSLMIRPVEVAARVWLKRFLNYGPPLLLLYLTQLFFV